VESGRGGSGQTQAIVGTLDIPRPAASLNKEAWGVGIFTFIKAALIPRFLPDKPAALQALTHICTTFVVDSTFAPTLLYLPLASTCWPTHWYKLCPRSRSQCYHTTFSQKDPNIFPGFLTDYAKKLLQRKK